MSTGFSGRRGPRPAVLALAAAIFLSRPAAGETIRMAWFPVPPHVYVAADGQGPAGPTIALFERIAERMGCEVEWVGPIPISRLGSYQVTRQVDLDGTILHMKASAIAPYLYYPERPYFVAVPSIAVRADGPLREIRSFEDIRGFRIGFVRTLSSVYPPIIADHRDELTLEELGGEDWLSRNLKKLLAGRLDAVYERNQYSIPYQALADGVEDEIRILAVPSAPIEHYYVFHRNSPRAAELLSRYNRAVEGLAFDYDAMVREEMDRLGRAKR